MASRKFSLLLLASFVLPMLVAQEQPLPYSHKTHLRAGLQCASCHTNPDPGDKMEFPAASRCMTCHTSIAKDRPAIQKLAEYAASGQKIPWVRLYTVAAGTFWSHRLHREAGKTCENCHGDVASMERIEVAKDVTSMGGCVACHRQSKAPTGCETCHEGK
jgi:hypothetical protein